MHASHTHVPLAGSEVVHHPRARKHRPTPRDKKLHVTLVLEPRRLPDDHPVAHKMHAIRTELPHGRPRFSHAELERVHAPDTEHIEAVRRFAAAHELRIVDTPAARHDVVLEGPVRALERAFGVRLHQYLHAGRVYHAHEGPVHVPRELREGVSCVLGLDAVPLVDHPYVAAPATDALPPPRLAERYRFPPHTTGKGQRIALVQFGGGYHAADVRDFFRDLGLSPPALSDRLVHGARNAPLERKRLGAIAKALRADPVKARADYAADLPAFAATLEATMDIQIAGSLAPGAELVAVFAPPTARGWRGALYAALHEPAATVVSVSWGNAEYRFGDGHVCGIGDALEAARLRQVTVCCASGDFGSRATSDAGAGLAAVAFPASSPLALACGGTARHGSRGEVAWNGPGPAGRFASGGGVSGRFARPDFQRPVGVPVPSPRRRTWVHAGHPRAFAGRGVPDVAAHADMQQGYRLLLGGQPFHGGGTSAASPLWAALVARLNEALGYPLGWLNPALYRAPVARAFLPVDRGDNDVSGGAITYYRASPGWDACTGLGAPDGVRLLAALRRQGRS